MRKRLRKKRHLGEFKEEGFNVTFSFDGDALEQDVFLDRFIEAVETNGLTCGGGFGKEWDMYITMDGRGTATETDRMAVLNWLEGQPAVKNISVGPLVDAWWGW